MDKTHNISLGGFSFTIENDAYQKLSTYLMKVRQFLGDSSDTNEIIFDVEQRMAELLKAHTQTVEVVTQEDVDYLIEVLGKPEQYVDESQEAITEEKRTKFSFKGRKLYRDMDDKKIGGVLSGISYYFQIDVSLLRIIFLLLFLTNSFAFFFSTSLYYFLGSSATSQYNCRKVGDERSSSEFGYTFLIQGKYSFSEKRMV